MLAAAALAVLSSPQAPVPLLSPPSGWRGERIDFPLAFAPEIELRGFEELAFAPGMFAPESDSYFSYALALRLEGEVEIDAPFLDSFLETYYRGLCRAVAGDRGLALDLDSIAADVTRAGARFTATVRMFDPFTTGAPLELALELESHATPRATEVLGLASPLDREAPVWEELHALAARWRAARPAPVFLNHVYFAVDRATYDALVASEFLRRVFAVSEERETVRADSSYSGLYFYGRRTYFEFLPPGAAGLEVGASGIALGLETAGATNALGERLRERGASSQAFPITRALDGKPLPWFHLLGTEMPSAPLTLFTMEYDPGFLAGWHADLAPAAGIARADVLARYAAALDASSFHARAPFADVAAVELALDDPQRERVLAVLAAAGHEVEARTDEWLVHAPGARLVVRRATQPGGITALELALREPLEREPLQLGKLELSFHGRTARLVLRP